MVKETVVGLDLGTSKVLVVVGEINAKNEIDVVGIGHHPTRGLRRGVVADIESTVESIRRAVEEAELMTDHSISTVSVGISGDHISSFNSHGVVAISDGEVAQADVDQVIDAAKAMAIPNDQRVLHVVPQDFVIDGQNGIRQPVGMSGVRMEAHVHVVTCAESAAQNIIKCVRRGGLEADDIVLEQIASSEAVLSEDERDLGVCMVDIGGGTTDIAVFSDGALHHSAVIAIAGDHVTRDIAYAFGTPTSAAEEIKKRHGCALAKLVNEAQTIEAPSRGGRAPRALSRQKLAEIIEPRVDELLGLVQKELRHSGFEELVGAGLVLTGGSSRIEGMVELAEEIFHFPVRLGTPNYERALSEVVCTPIYATGIGLMQYGHASRMRRAQRGSGGVRGRYGRVKGWFKRNF